MSMVLLSRAWKSRGLDGAIYSCKDGVYIHCKCKALEIDEDTSSKMDNGKVKTKLKNGI